MCEQVAEAHGEGDPRAAGGGPAARRGGHHRGRPDRRRARRRRGARRSRCSPCRRRWPPTCGSWSRRSTAPATSSGWATSPCTSPRPRAAGTRTRCCPTEVAPYFAEMGRVGVALARKAGDVIRTRDLGRGRRAGDRRRRDGRPAPAHVHGADGPQTGPTASRPRSTSRCSPGSTSATPTTPSPWPAGSSTSSPAGCPGRWPSEARSWHPPRRCPAQLDQLCRAARRRCATPRPPRCGTRPPRCSRPGARLAAAGDRR